jgi:hypothetical protein
MHQWMWWCPGAWGALLCVYIVNSSNWRNEIKTELCLLSLLVADPVAFLGRVIVDYDLVDHYVTWVITPRPTLTVHKPDHWLQKSL